MDLFVGPDLGHYTDFLWGWEMKEEEVNCPAPGGIRTHNLSSFSSQGVCSSTVLQPLPKFHIKVIID